MKKLIITTVVLAATFAVSTAQAGIFGWRNNRGPAVQSAPVAVAPATVTTARADNGYRSFSYQPTAPVYVAPTYGFQNRQPTASGGFHDAGWKIRGF
jgi:hypothetical protein